jgi:hypothetical protein
MVAVSAVWLRRALPSNARAICLFHRMRCSYGTFRRAINALLPSGHYWPCFQHAAPSVDSGSRVTIAA